MFKLLTKGLSFNKKEAINQPKKNEVDSEQKPTSFSKNLDFFNVEKDKHIVLQTEKKVPVDIVEDPVKSIQLVDLSTKLQVKTFRKTNKISVEGTDVPFPVQTFENLNLKQFILKNMTEFKLPTPIQMQAIPIVLKERDILACAPTGSGKTLAFAIPILHMLAKPQKGGFRAVIISPTRELAQQVIIF